MFLHVVVVVLALCTQPLSVRSFQTLSVGNGGVWGDWGPTEFCPHGSYANGFSIQMEYEQGGGDDTAMNSISLTCVEDNGTYRGTVASKLGFWGHWTPVVSCKSGALTSFQLRVEGKQGDGDDTAANNIKFRCSSGEVLDPNGMYWGDWGDWSEACHEGGKICGIQTRVEPRLGGKEDDTALNDVRFVCCAL